MQGFDHSQKMQWKKSKIECQNVETENRGLKEKEGQIKWKVGMGIKGNLI